MLPDTLDNAMRNRSLLLAGPFGPFIVRGSHNRRRPVAAEPTAGGRRLYHLVAVGDGAATLAGDGSAVRHLAPAAFLLTPHAGLRLECSAGSSWGELLFQVVHAARAPGRGGHNWVHRGPAQPPSEAIFGRHLPAVVPPPLVEEAIAVVAVAGGTYFKSDLHHAEGNAQLGRWLLRYARHQEQATEPGAEAADPWSRAERYARDQLDMGCTVVDLARAVGMGRSAFADGYRRARGRTPGDFLAGLRFEVAARELAAGRDVLGAAQLCGFRSPTAFSAFFKRRAGMPPSRWRRRQAGIG
jgi:AraC-like DNA-binding protein